MPQPKQNSEEENMIRTVRKHNTQTYATPELQYLKKNPQIPTNGNLMTNSQSTINPNSNHICRLLDRLLRYFQIRDRWKRSNSSSNHKQFRQILISTQQQKHHHHKNLKVKINKYLLRREADLAQKNRMTTRSKSTLATKVRGL